MRISRFLQTPFISYEDKNMLYFEVADWDMCNPYEVNIFIDGEAVFGGKIFAASFSSAVITSGQAGTHSTILVSNSLVRAKESSLRFLPVHTFPVPAFF